MNSPFSALTGSHQFGIWYASPTRFRLAEQGSFSENDLRRDGGRIWLWNSRTQTATRVLLPRQVSASHGGSAGGVPSAGPLSSPAAIGALLAAAGRSTVITVGQNVTVAGRPAYQLVIKPKTNKSLIGRIDIAIDAARHIPVQLEVFARGAAQPGRADRLHLAVVRHGRVELQLHAAAGRQGADGQGLGAAAVRRSG